MSEATVADDGVTAGTLLREAREGAGLHVATLAANLKVPVRKLEALEEDRYDQLGDAVFVRALASSVCRTLKLDPQPVLGRLPQTAQPRLVLDTEAINAPFRSPRDGPAPGVLQHASRPVVFTVAALLIGALVIMFLPLVQSGLETITQANFGATATPPAAAPSPDTQVTTFPAAVPAAEPLPAATDHGAPAGATPAVTVPSSAAVVPGPVPQPASTPTPAPGLAAVETPAAPVPANAVVVFRTRGPSWIQVTDARGTTVLRRLMAAGESAGAVGALPLAVTVGDAGQTDVQVRGKPFNLAPQTRDNVARFEVK